MLLPLILGSVLFIAALSENQRVVVFDPFNRTANLYGYTTSSENTQKPLMHGGDNIRLKIIESSLEKWKERPFLGTGLGGGMAAQKEQYGEVIDVIDNTALWILTDMGLAGLFIFAASYASMLLALKRRIKSNAFALCAFLMLLVFGVFSLVHEILYTRFFWFILGLALARPPDQSPPPPQS